MIPFLISSGISIIRFILLCNKLGNCASCKGHLVTVGTQYVCTSCLRCRMKEVYPSICQNGFIYDPLMPPDIGRLLFALENVSEIKIWRHIRNNLQTFAVTTAHSLFLEHVTHVFKFFPLSNTESHILFSSCKRKCASKPLICRWFRFNATNLSSSLIRVDFNLFYPMFNAESIGGTHCGTTLTK